MAASAERGPARPSHAVDTHDAVSEQVGDKDLPGRRHSDAPWYEEMVDLGANVAIRGPDPAAARARAVTRAPVR